MLGQNDAFNRRVDIPNDANRLAQLEEKALDLQAQNKQAEAAQHEDKTPLSVALLNQKVAPKDIMAKFTDKLTKTRGQNALESFSDAVSDKMEKNIESFFGSTTRLSSFQDKPEISQQSRNAGAFISEERKTNAPKKKVETWDLILDADDGKPQKTEETQKAAQIKAIPAETLKEISTTVKSYLATYALALATDDFQKKTEAKDLKDSLMDMGMPPEKLIIAEHNVKKMMYQDLKNQIKTTMLQVALIFTDVKGGKYIADKTAQFTKLKELGKKFGISDAEIKNFGQENSEELKTFIFQELDRATQHHLSNNEGHKLNETFKRYDALTRSIGADASGYVQKFHKKIEDLGLKALFLPSGELQKKGILDSLESFKKKEKNTQTLHLNRFLKGMKGTSSDGKSSGQKNEPEKNQEETVTELEKQLDELAFGATGEDQLRSLYIQKWIRRDLQSRIKIHFQLVKLLKNLKIDSEKHLKIQQEAKVLARFKLIDLLREGFEERATLAELKGPTHQLIRDKFKLALGGLQAMGQKLSKTELDGMRDTINKTMFSIIRDEYIKVEIYLEGNPPEKGFAKKKRQELLATLHRLKAESNIPDEVRPKSFQDITLKSDITVIDVA
jgi:hypothetical protein